MNTEELIVMIALFVIAAATALISIRCFRNKGYLFNNAYIYASEEERKTMDKKPYYRQSAIVFLILSMVFIVVGVSIIFGERRILLLEIPLLSAVVIYAIVSSIQIRKKQKKQ